MHLKNKSLKPLIILSLLLLMASSVAFYGFNKASTENMNTTYTYINLELGDYIYESLLKQILHISKNGELHLLKMEETNVAIEDWILKLDSALLEHSEIQPSQISTAYKSEAITIWQYYWNNKELLEKISEDDYKKIIDRIQKISSVRKDEYLDKWPIEQVDIVPLPVK